MNSQTVVFIKMKGKLYKSLEVIWIRSYLITIMLLINLPFLI